MDQLSNKNQERDGEFDEESEDETAAILSAEQDLNIAQEDLRSKIEEVKNYRKPSKPKYVFLFTIAGIMDIVDLLDVTIVGIVISKIVSIAGTGIIYFTLWLTDTHFKKAQKYKDDLYKVALNAEYKTF